MHGVTTTVEFPYEDVDLEEIFNAFRTVLVGATFHQSQYENYIVGLGEILLEEKNNNHD